MRTPFLLKLCSKGLSSGLQFGDFGLCGLYLGLQDGASLQSLLQAWLYSETMDRRVWAAMLLLLAGGMALVLDQGLQGGVQLMGLLAVLLATVAWGVDNTLSRGLAERDPSQVVMAKATLGAVVTAALAVSTGEPWPSLSAALGLLAVGATGYGLSLRFYLLAQRAFGAARTGSVFAFAPFIGAAVAFGFGDRPAGLLMLLGLTLLAAVAGLYPARGRLLVFAVPAVALLLGAGVELLVEYIKGQVDRLARIQFRVEIDRVGTFGLSCRRADFGLMFGPVAKDLLLEAIGVHRGLASRIEGVDRK